MVTRTTDRHRQSEKTRENGVDGKNQENLEHLCAKKDQFLPNGLVYRPESRGRIALF